MNPFILTTLTVFVIFIAWVESYQARLSFKKWKSEMDKTWGRADWVYPVRRQTQEWMRTNTIQTYK